MSGIFSDGLNCISQQITTHACPWLLLLLELVEVLLLVRGDIAILSVAKLINAWQLKKALAPHDSTQLAHCHDGISCRTTYMQHL
jgi:hypothetical protein